MIGPLDVCCPICWGMPDDGFDDVTRKECVGDGLVVGAASPSVGVHPQRIALAVWLSEPLRDWPEGLGLGWRNAPEPKVIQHPEFEHGRLDGAANRRRKQVASNWRSLKQNAYSSGYAAGQAYRHNLLGLPVAPDGSSAQMLTELADCLARNNGDRAGAGVEYLHHTYIADQLYHYFPKWLPLCPLNDPPPPPDRTRQMHLMEAAR
jgi:hypothetical protein